MSFFEASVVAAVQLSDEVLFATSLLLPSTTFPSIVLLLVKQGGFFTVEAPWSRSVYGPRKKVKQEKTLRLASRESCIHHLHRISIRRGYFYGIVFRA
jgi:hypothetical protein